MLKMSVNVILMEFLFGYDNINVITYEQSLKDEITPQDVAQFIKDTVCCIPWGHIRFILDKKYDPQKSFFFVQQTILRIAYRALKK